MGARMLYIITIIVIINSVFSFYFYRKCYLEEKETATGWEGGFTNKTVWTCIYASYLCANFFFCMCACFFFYFWLFLVKKFLVFQDLTIVFCKFDKNENK